MAIRCLSHRKPPEMAVTALFCDESNADASGCMNMGSVPAEGEMTP